VAAGTAGIRVAAPPPRLPDAGRHCLAGRIETWEPRSYGVLVTLRVRAVDGVAAPGAFTVECLGDDAWGSAPVSGWARITGRWEPARGPTNPGQPRFSTAQGRLIPAGEPDWGPGGRPGLPRLRSALVGRLRSRLQGFAARFGEALLLGRSSALLPVERTAFRSAGLSHLVAVSGLHVGLAALLAAQLAGAAGRGRRYLAAILAAGTYATLAGWSPSSARATAMVAAVGAGTWLGRRRGAAGWLFLALPWLLWAEPRLGYEVGFRLSLGATAGILFAHEVGGRVAGRWGRILTPILVSLGAQWGTLPTVLATFGGLPPLSVLPNLLAVPLAGFLLPAVLLTLVLPWGWGGALAAAAATTLAEGILRVAVLAGNLLPYWSLLPCPPVMLQVMCAVLMGVWFLLPAPRRVSGRARFAAGGAAVLLAGLVLWPWPPERGPWVAFLDVGQADAAVLRLSDGSVWVIDVGDDRGPGDAAANVIVPFLRRSRIRAVDGVILSHRHRDHVGALDSFLSRVPVDAVYDTGIGAGETAATVDSALARWRVPLVRTYAGDTLHAGPGASLVARYPPRPEPGAAPPDNLNDASLVVSARDAGLSILFAGDLEAAGEQRCLNAAGVDSVLVLKAGHHGSRTSTTEAWLRATGPRWAVVSCGEHNRYGHPGAETLARLAEHGVAVYRTDRRGAVRFRPERRGSIRVAFGDGPYRAPPGPDVGRAADPPDSAGAGDDDPRRAGS